MLEVRIGDGAGKGGRSAIVTSSGQLVVAPLHFDETKFQELSVADAIVNFYLPKPKQQFIITGMRIKANRAVSNTVDATIVIFEADSSTSGGAGGTPDKVLHQEALIRGEGANLFPVNILVNEGAYINAKTDDASVFITIFGYYIEAISD